MDAIMTQGVCEECGEETEVSADGFCETCEQYAHQKGGKHEQD